ncbi:GntR family transcriptional regulator [Streptomyces hawaiiensis]|uniref:GntR family transcriptional regulator n=1 Tax=Streptomyces hawaiiensis TaxID=67305 RepID=UPI00364D19F1
MGPKSERVYRTIREWIATGQYPPGSKLPSERTLSEELASSDESSETPCPSRPGRTRRRSTRSYPRSTRA